MRYFWEVVRIVILFFLGALSCTDAYAQALSEAFRVWPVAGDAFYISTDKQPKDVLLRFKGQEQVWDFSWLRAPFARRHRFMSEGDHLRLPMLDQDVVYEVTSQQVFMSEIRNSDPLLIGDQVDMKFYPALLEFHNPINYLDASSHYSRLIGYTTWDAIPTQYWLPGVSANDTLRIERECFRDDVVDGSGQVLLRAESHEVMRIHRNEVRLLHVYVRDGRRWLDQTAHFKRVLEGVRWEETVYKYLFVPRNGPRPLIEVCTDEYDTPLWVDFMSKGRFERPIRMDEKVAGLYAYPNPTFGDDVRFEIFNVRPGNYRIEVYTILGSLVYEQDIKIPDQEVWQADLTFLSRGTYVYSLIDEMGKRLYARRLVIIKP